MTSTHKGLAHLLGALAGGVCRWLLQLERRAVAWLCEQGLPTSVAQAIQWMARVVAGGALLYAASWLALVIALVVVMSLVRTIDADDEFGEWRNGLEGFGYYEKGVRTDHGRLFEDDQS